MRQKKIRAAGIGDDHQRSTWTSACVLPPSFGYMSSAFPPLPTLPMWMAPPSLYSWPSMQPFHHSVNSYSHYWTSSATLSHAVAAPNSPTPSPEMARVASSPHINSLVAQYSHAHTFPVASLVGRPEPAGSLGVTLYNGHEAVGVRSPAEAAVLLPCLVESPIQSEAATATSDSGESTGVSGTAGRTPLEASRSDDVEEGVVNCANAIAAEVRGTAGYPSGRLSQVKESGDGWQVTSGTRRAMEEWMEEVEVGGGTGMGPFDWLDEPSTAEEGAGLPPWVLAELEEDKAAGEGEDVPVQERVEERMYRILFRTDSMESSSDALMTSSPGQYLSPGDEGEMENTGSLPQEQAPEGLAPLFAHEATVTDTGSEQQGESSSVAGAVVAAVATFELAKDSCKEVMCTSSLSRSSSTSWMKGFLDDESDLTVLRESGVMWKDVFECEDVEGCV